jgi:hypothetical protein
VKDKESALSIPLYHYPSPLPLSRYRRCTHLLDAQLITLPQPLQRPHRLLLQLTWGSSPSAVPKHAPGYDIIACSEVPLTQAIYSRPHMDLEAPEARMDFLPAEDSGRRGMLDEAIFPAFGNDAGSPSAESPEQMKKNDPLGTQIWKLYSRAKTQLPNAERMENLTWRMMAMNMRRAELDRNRGYEFRHVPRAGRASAPCDSLCTC